VVLLGQLGTAAYFAFFPLLWIIGKVEKPRPLPQSIAQPVLKPMEKI
jgi:ubiquinol-cytochrome c reductase cytochrome b subunit